MIRRLGAEEPPLLSRCVRPGPHPLTRSPTASWARWRSTPACARGSGRCTNAWRAGSSPWGGVAGDLRSAVSSALGVAERDLALARPVPPADMVFARSVDVWEGAVDGVTVDALPGQPSAQVDGLFGTAS